VRVTHRAEIKDSTKPLRELMGPFCFAKEGHHHDCLNFESGRIRKLHYQNMEMTVKKRSKNTSGG
jgi:hypothetical protein